MAAIPHTAAMAPSSTTQAALALSLSTTSPAVKMTAALASASASTSLPAEPAVLHPSPPKKLLHRLSRTSSRV
ncbi:hypothetical protein D6D25_08147 [Aureobasidium pullulans]|nr:hypothetical protein D6D25_08147 [Aureobasidium pullulans]